MKSYKKTFLIIILIIFVLLFLIRLINPRQIDDVSPGIYCEQKYLEKADILWVIPMYNSTPISNNQTWCEEIKTLNKTLGMHGIQHYYNEFEDNLTNQQIEEGIQIFEDCLGIRPEIFKSPKLATSKKNKIKLYQQNLRLKAYSNQLFNKVYHCSNTGTFPNWFHDLF